MLVFQPVQMKRDQSLVVTHTKFADGSVRTGEQRAVQLIVYDAEADQTGQHAVLFRNLQVIAGAGAGGGPHVKAFNAYTPLENLGPGGRARGGDSNSPGSPGREEVRLIW